MNCVSLAAVASSVEGPEGSRIFSDIHHQWGHSGQCQTLAKCMSVLRTDVSTMPVSVKDNKQRMLMCVPLSSLG